MFSLSVACAVLSLTCALGLLASIAVTFATQGRALLAACTFESPELPTLAPDCPFDPTRIYVSASALGGAGKGSWDPCTPVPKEMLVPLSPAEL